MARGRGKATPHDLEAMKHVSGMLQRLLAENNLKQSHLADRLEIPRSSFNEYVKGTALPRPGNVQKIADYFGLKKSDIDPRFKSTRPSISATAPNSLIEQVSEKMVQLTEKGKKDVLRFTSELLEREEADRIVQEEPLFKIYFRSAAKAGPKGYGYDDYDADFAYTNQEPPRHDVATKVDGDSMNPDYQDGDILYLRDYGASHYNGDECVVVIDDKSYFKRLYTTEDGLKLVSTNPDKDTYPDIFIDFPPSDGSHIKIFNVVGSFTPVEM
ncbi:TPA: helix-turn-helix domain-containing protein [Streptococcus suis]|nr:helix-turn-helix domain-containing protein [Streptococcus suis]HEM3676079.1 helix-turn-helix domain-containing protein [Streptococcus suis]